MNIKHDTTYKCSFTVSAEIFIYNNPLWNTKIIKLYKNSMENNTCFVQLCFNHTMDTMKIIKTLKQHPTKL